MTAGINDYSNFEGSKLWLGRHLLVAPILWEGITEREIYFPHGEWRDYWTGKGYEGDKKFMFSCELGHIPVFSSDAISKNYFYNFPNKNLLQKLKFTTKNKNYLL